MGYLNNKEKLYIDGKCIYDKSKVNLSEDSPGFMGFDKFMIYLEALNEYSEGEVDPMDPFAVSKSFECFLKDKLEEEGFERNYRTRV